MIADRIAKHATTAVVASVVAVGVVAALPKHVEQVTHSISTSKHAWPDLADPEKDALARVLHTLPKDTKFDIVCNDAGCSDLAADIDDAMEMAGLDSVLDRSIGPLGYGVGVRVNEADKDAAARAVEALESATSGRLAPELKVADPGQNPPGYVTILIGKYRR